MKKKTLLMLFGILVLGIAIGAVTMSLISNKKLKSYSEPMTKERFTEKVMRLIDPDEEQLAKINSIIDVYAVRAADISIENKARVIENLESLYSELNPFLNEAQKQKFEGRISRMKQKIGK